MRETDQHWISGPLGFKVALLKPGSYKETSISADLRDLALALVDVVL